MKILFIDMIKRSYNTTTPLKEPLGGSQSAIAYLSAALVRAGHEVAVIIGGDQAGETDGVRFMTLPCQAPVINSYDIVVLLSWSLGGTMRQIGCDRPMVLWCQNATDDPGVQPLRSPVERDLFAGFAMVSEWQAETYRRSFGIDARRQHILRNAASPSFIDMPARNNWLQTGAAPVFGYSSTPFRGLDLLLLSFPAIQSQIPDATLRIFSGMGIYYPNSVDPYASLYAVAAALPGVDYVGPLPQPQLAAAMADVDIWSYPCTFPETSCISAMEAMACGALMVTTGIGALPETTAGFARIADIGDIHAAGLAATLYANQVLQAVAEAAASSELSLQRLALQVAFAGKQYNWTSRAEEWAQWLATLVV